MYDVVRGDAMTPLPVAELEQYPITVMDAACASRQPSHLFRVIRKICVC